MKTLSHTTNKPVRAAFAAALALSLPTAGMMALSTPVQAQSSPADLDKAVAALRGISTMKADFVQTDRLGQSVNGVMTLKRPGKIRFEYEKTVPMLIVSNGKSLYYIDYEVNQVQRWPIQKSPLGALLDPSRDVRKYGKLVSTGNPNVVSVEVRDKSRPEFGVITMIFVRKASAPGGLELASWVANDSQNQRTTVRLTGHRYGASIADSAFRFRDPRRSSRRPG